MRYNISNFKELLRVNREMTGQVSDPGLEDTPSTGDSSQVNKVVHPYKVPHTGVKRKIESTYV